MGIFNPSACCSGIYGIGGGAIIASFIMAFYHIPIHALAAASLIATFAASLMGVIFLVVISQLSRQNLAPDWPLGILLGLGGFAGIYLGARIHLSVKEV